ncbi:MAG: T9SS type A sorting domain-containing protein [Fibrobacteres bacterium]|nr:T9SS type A sorting domain-containing protein [Fibrobacterota bacterium]
MRKLFLFIPLLLLFSCRPIPLASLVTFGIYPKGAIQTQHDFEVVAFGSVFYYPKKPYEHNLHRDSLIIAPLLPSGFDVRSISYVLIDQKNVQTYQSLISSPAIRKYADSVIAAEGRKGDRTIGDISDSLLFRMIYEAYRKDAVEATRKPDLDLALKDMFGKQDRRFVTFSGPASFTLTEKDTTVGDTAFPILCISLITLTTGHIPGKYSCGLFTSFDDASMWLKATDTSVTETDTVLSCFQDGDTINVVPYYYTIKREESSSTPAFDIATFANPMSSGNQGITFVTDKKAKVSLYDVNGRPIFSKETGGLQQYFLNRLAGREISAGKYFITIEAEGKKRVSRPLIVVK